MIDPRFQHSLIIIQRFFQSLLLACCGSKTQDILNPDQEIDRRGDLLVD